MDRRVVVGCNLGNLVTVGSSILALSTMMSATALGQSTTKPDVLPEVTVEPPKPDVAPPKSAAKPAAVDTSPKKVVKQKPKAKPVDQTAIATEPEKAVEPTPENARTGESRDSAIQTKNYSTPAAVSSVGVSDISTFGQADMGDVLRSVPGTSVRESPDNPGVAVNIRGFEGSGRVNMMIDGVRQNFRFTGHEAQGFVYVDQSLLAGVDIARGAMSTVGGAGALAGSANFRTLDIIDVLKPGQTLGVLTTGSWGSNGQGWSGMTAGAATNGHVGLIGAISGRNPNDYENGLGVDVPYTAQDLQSGLAKAEFQLTEEQKIKFGGVFYNNEFVANSYDQTLSSKIFTFNYNYRPVGTDLVDLRVNASRSDVTMNYGGLFSNPLGGSARGRNINDLGTGFDVSNVSILRFGGVGVRSEYGYEYFHDDFDVINSTAVPGRGVNPSGESSIQGVFSATNFTYGMFGLLAGARYDSFAINGSGSVAAGNPLGLPAGAYQVDRSDGRFNPKVTLSLTPTQWFQPYVTYAESMRAPTVNETFTGGAHPSVGPPQFFFPNPFLQPEIQKGWEFGFNTSVDRVLTPRDFIRFKADYFSQNVDNYITAAFGPAGQTYFANNAGISDVEGVELQGMYDSGLVFAGMSYTWSHTNLPSQVNGFGGQSFLPDHVASVSGGVRLLDERWTLGARGFYASDAFIGVINAIDPNHPYTNGYALLDLFTSYKVTPDIELGATMSNVFDTAYTPATSTPATGGFAGDTGRGRTTIATVRAKF